MSAEEKDPFGTTSCRLFKMFECDVGRLMALADTHPFGFMAGQMYDAMVRPIQEQLKEDRGFGNARRREQAALRKNQSR